MTTLPQTTSIQLPRPMSTAGPIAPINVGGPIQSGIGQPQMTGGDIWRVLRTNIWMFIIVLVGSIVLGIGLHMFLDAKYSRYTAVGYIQIQSGRKGLGLLANRGMDEAVDDSSTLVVEQRTQAQILMTDSLFTRVLQDPNKEIRKTEWFAQFLTPEGTPDIAAAKEDLGRKFSATPISESKLISVSMTYSNPKDCRTIVLDIVGQHIDDQRKVSTDRLGNRNDLYTGLRSKYETRIRALKQETSQKAGELQLDAMGRPGGVAQKEQELFQLTTARLKAEGEATVAREAYKSAQETIQQGGTPGMVEMTVSSDPDVRMWKSQLDSIDVQMRAAVQGNAAKSTQNLKDTKSAIQDKLEELRAIARANTTVAYMEKLHSEAATTQGQVEAIGKQIERVRLDLSDMTFQLSSYLTKKDEETANQELLRRVNDQLDMLGTQQQAIDMNAVAWNTQPVTPDTPSFPCLGLTLGTCVALGMGLSLALAFLREMMDTSVRSPRDIARVGQLTLLGMIPHEDDDPQAAGVPLPTVIYAAPQSMLAEQFRQVRTRLQHAASLDTTRSILITSPSPGDGKSVVACNLAAGLALNGRRILLVDANFRRPELHKIFGVGNEAGFSNVLNAVENFESAVRQTRVPNLDLMTTGAKPANATELLESQLLIDFIERALEEYDHVIFDTGPMLLVSETVALAPRVDGVVTVVRARNNSRGLLQRMKETLRQLKAENLGVVLNGVRSTGGGYYGRNIKTYYEYQNTTAE